MGCQLERFKVLGAGVISLILMLGIARFAYTPLLPVMQEEAGLSLAQGGWLASINYMGYLCGAIAASLIKDIVLKDKLYRLGLVVAVVTTAGMGLTEQFWLWSLLRFLAGMSSAAGLLLGSGLILYWLLGNGHRSELGIHFSGMGLGIVFCTLAVEFMGDFASWDAQWLWLSLFGALMLIPAWRWLPSPNRGKTGSRVETLAENPPDPLFLRIFILAYFCAGVGYVVSATFIVAIVDQLPGLEGKGGWSFLVVGLAAAPACILWDLVARCYGYLNALSVAFALQVVGILLPVVEPQLGATLLGATLFGATFIGIVSLVLTMAGQFYPAYPAKMMGTMTISYGLAQILAPAVVGELAEGGSGYGDGLIMAALFMAVGNLLILFCMRGKNKSAKERPC